MAANEVSKLQRHLALLREEYVKLQGRAAELERQCSMASRDEDSFVCRLLHIVASLYNQELYSDLIIHLDGTSLRAHKFVLEARSSKWGVLSLPEVDSLDLTDVPQEIGSLLFKWVYTDKLPPSLPDSTLLRLMALGRRFSLSHLISRCEQGLLSSVTVTNCIDFYQNADEIGAETLRKYCSELIATHWDDFGPEDFAHMKAPLLYKMLKAKSPHPLHASIKIKREDVVFLYLIEFDSQLHDRLNQPDSEGLLPLELALSSRQDSVASSLVSHGANVDGGLSSGETLLHRAIRNEDAFAALFLTSHGAAVNVVAEETLETPLHLAAQLKHRGEEMAEVVSSLLEHHASPNRQDMAGNTPLHTAVRACNEPVFHSLLGAAGLNLELQNKEGHTALWVALAGADSFDPSSLPALLIQRGANVDAVSSITGDSLLHMAALNKLEEAGIFLVNHGANTNALNHKGESPLHLACSQGLAALCGALLRHGSNPNMQTQQPQGGSNLEGEVAETFNQTPLHLAIQYQQLSAVQAILQYKTECCLNRQKGEEMGVIPNFNMADSSGETPLSLAVKNSLMDIAEQLLAGGASVNSQLSGGITLLHRSILDQDPQAALFLLDHGADNTALTSEKETPLELAVKRHLPAVVEALCQRGADLSTPDQSGNSPLWVALETGQEDVASILVKYHCDVDCWGPGPGGCYQSLLHRAIDENNESIACFLIRNGCDTSSPRRPGPDGRGEEEAYDGQTPLHLACTWGLEAIVAALLEAKADPNLQDAEGKTPLHIAVANMYPAIMSMLLACPQLDINLRDKQGQTPFAAAMSMRNNTAAEAILGREPKAAEQPDNRGRNYLHLAIQKNDIESVLFLLSIHVNVHSRVQDASQLTPLHIAVRQGTEIIVRNLLLAGANVNDLTPQRQSSLHLAALENHSAICSILLENHIEFDAVDCNGNNALHVACQNGHLDSCRVLLTESHINAEAVNVRGQNPLHTLASYSKENSAAIFELFLECMPQYPLNKTDAESNTALLLAYSNGNGKLCRALVRAGACLGATNRSGQNIFNMQVASRQLLTRLLDFLPNEPPWSEADLCMECGTKFGLKTRKHHCRHCGRVLCSKCSEKDIPILKFNLNKPVRVCNICFEVLTGVI